MRRTWRYRQFILAYAWGELRGRYLRHRLTTLWLVLNPILLAATYTFLILVLRKRDDPLQVLSFITSGLFFFMFFRDSIVKSAGSLTRATSLLLSSDLPKAALPAAATVESLLALGIAMTAYVPLHLLAGKTLDTSLLQLIPLLAIATTFAFGTSSILAFVAVRFRDLLPLVPFALRLLLYLSPVLFTVEDMSETLPEAIHWILWLNPLLPFLAIWHDALAGTATAPGLWGVTITWTLLALVAGLVLAHRNQHSIGKRL